MKLAPCPPMLVALFALVFTAAHVLALPPVATEELPNSLPQGKHGLVYARLLADNLKLQKGIKAKITEISQLPPHDPKWQALTGPKRELELVLRQLENSAASLGKGVVLLIAENETIQADIQVRIESLWNDMQPGAAILSAEDQNRANMLAKIQELAKRIDLRIKSLESVRDEWLSSTAGP